MSANDDSKAEKSAKENPQVADTDTSTNDDPSSEEQEDVKAGRTGSLSDQEVNLLNKLESMSDDERRKKLETMDTTGRSSEADKMRNILGIDKPNQLSQTELQKLLDAELKKRGLTPDFLDNVTKSQQVQLRDEAIRGLGLDPNEVARDEAFLKAYHSKELEGVSVEERTERAIARSFIGKQSRADVNKEEKARSMSTPNAGDHKSQAKGFNDMTLAEKKAWMRNATTDDLANTFG